MKSLIFIAFCLLFLACKNKATDNNITTIAADSLKKNVESFAGRYIATEGTVIHVCPVNGLKIKLRADDGSIIKVTTGNTFPQFDQDWNGKKVRITGTVREERIPRSVIDSVAANEVLLCHIDHTPCIDSAWVKNKKKQGVASSISEKETGLLKAEMEKTGKEYISVTVLVADKIEEIKIVTEKVQTSQNMPDKQNNRCGNCALCGLCFRKA